jgi:hypothetical protein
MQSPHFLVSPLGRIRPRAFVFAAIAVYLLGTASQWLTVPGVLARAGLWPFAMAQAALTWMWFALHAKRLRDSGHTLGLAVGVSLLYALAVVLLLTVADAFFNTSTLQAGDANTTSALGLILLISILALLAGSPHYDVAWLMVTVLTVMALLPIIIAVIVTIWAATRPSLQEPET